MMMDAQHCEFIKTIKLHTCKGVNFIARELYFN